MNEPVELTCEVSSVTLQRGMSNAGPGWVKVHVGTCGLTYSCRPDEAPRVGDLVRVTVTSTDEPLPFVTDDDLAEARRTLLELGQS